MTIDNRARLRLAVPLLSSVVVVIAVLLCTHEVDAALDDATVGSGLHQLWFAARTHEERTLVTSINSIVVGDLRSVNSRQTVTQIHSLPFGGADTSVLHWAACNGADNALRLLVRGIPGTVNCLLIPGYDAHSRWKQLLQCAIVNGHGGAVGILLDTTPEEFSIEAHDPILLLAAQCGSVEVARALFGNRGRPIPAIRVCDGTMVPTLRAAATWGNLDYVSELVDNILVSNPELMNARDMAERNHHPDVVQKLEDIVQRTRF
ncbi:Ankyrin repeat domain-containing protein [Plasmodiophora brassicae]